MPTPQEQANAFIQKVVAAKAAATQQSASMRARATQVLAPVTALFGAVAAALDQQGNVHGSIKPTYAFIGTDGRYMTQFVLTRADMNKRIVNLSSGVLPDGSDSIWISGLGPEAAKSAPLQGLTKAGDSQAFLDEFSFSAANAAKASDFLAAQIGDFFAKQAW